MAIKLKGLSPKLTAFLADCSFPCDVTGPGTVQLVMLRGCRATDKDLRVQPTKRDQYSDVLVAYGLKGNGDPFLATFRASARPGAYWVDHPSYTEARGCPTLQPGQYLYQRGLHKGRKAMVQAGRVVVWRDADDDWQLDLEEALRPDYSATAINIHAGGTNISIGIWSSGCQIVWGGWGGTPWLTFRDLVYRVASEQKLFSYTVIDYAMLCEWWNAPEGKKPQWLLYGSVGQQVTRLQNVLMEYGWLRANHVTGKFDPDTDLAVRRRQEFDGVNVTTGIVRL